MEFLFQVNPILIGNSKIIIYGVGQEQKRIFCALLQQNISVTAFCLKKQQNKEMKQIFGKKVLSFEELKEQYRDAYIILSANDACHDSCFLNEIGMKNIIVENITIESLGILVEDD